jgi:hypothetical protein
VEFPSRYYVLLFVGGCGDYSGVFCLSVEMYERVEYGSVDGFNAVAMKWYFSITYMMLSAGWCWCHAQGLLCGPLCIVTVRHC